MPRKKSPFIDGIFNYCDRWCERCPFTQRCRLFADERKVWGDAPAEARDPQNQAFWDKLHGVFDKTFAMLEDMLRERGIELSDFDMEAAQEEMERSDARRYSNALFKTGEAYAGKVEKWFKKHEVLFKRKGKELIKQIRLGLEGPDPEVVAQRLQDAVDVVHWYQFQIAVKLNRAADRDDEEDDPEMAKIEQYDSDGSAKVALIGIDRSVAAWAELRELLPDHRDTILDFLALLAKLRRDTEAAYPNARAFVRPGFDTEKP